MAMGAEVLRTTDTPTHLAVRRVFRGQLRTTGVDPAIIHAFEQTGMLVWEYNQDLFTSEQLAAWEQALHEYRTSRAA